MSYKRETKKKWYQQLGNIFLRGCISVYKVFQKFCVSIWKDIDDEMRIKKEEKRIFREERIKARFEMAKERGRRLPSENEKPKKNGLRFDPPTFDAGFSQTNFDYGIPKRKDSFGGKLTDLEVGIPKNKYSYDIKMRGGKVENRRRKNN